MIDREAMKQTLIDKINSLCYDANFAYQDVSMGGFNSLMTEAFTTSELTQIKKFLDHYFEGTEDGTPIQK